MDELAVVENGYNIAPIAGAGISREWTEDEKRQAADKMREYWENRKQQEIRDNVESDRRRNRKWYDEAGAADQWLKENDPCYGNRKKVDYLTARQFKYRAYDCEIPTDPVAMDTTMTFSDSPLVVQAAGWETLFGKNKEGTKIDP